MDFENALKEVLVEGGFSWDSNNLKLISRGKGCYLYRYSNSRMPLFIKYFYSSDGGNQASAEVDGLKALQSGNTVRCPEVVFQASLLEGGVFAMENIDISEKGRQEAMPTFGRQLAQLHKNGTATTFGYPTDNFIGGLPQVNNPMENWAEFYYRHRLRPQIQMSVDSGLLSPWLLDNPDKWIEVVGEVYPNEPPALLHGDLWGGNMIADSGANPYLIDPAVYFGHREMDIAMTMLFGGFDHHFYNAYEKEYPLSDGFHSRADLSQLYYLLVHVNLFGKSYVRSTLTTVKKYFG